MKKENQDTIQTLKERILYLEYEMEKKKLNEEAMRKDIGQTRNELVTIKAKNAEYAVCK
jgi:hypothetical protein